MATVKALVSVSLIGLTSVTSADVVFSDAPQQYVAKDTAFIAQTPKQTVFPNEVGTPIFWLDCAETNGWMVTAAGGVLKLPSKVPGSSRYLTSDKGDLNFSDFSWQCWGWPLCTEPSRQVWVTPPTLTPPGDGLAGHGVLDFGEQGSARGLIFDLWRPDESCVPSNTLANIGSVFAVYDSSKGGGWFLGGGFGKQQSGYCWHRGASPVDADDNHLYCSPLFTSHAFDSLNYGTTRHFGISAANNAVGFNGGWEMLTLCPQNGMATQDATGLGVGDLRTNGTSYWNNRSGGMRIAEMIFFDRVLSDEEAEKVEVYLRTKWLTIPAGWNGNAVLASVACDSKTDDKLGNGVRLTVDAGASETVAVHTVNGGHLDSAFVKTGSGTLAFGAASNFNTPLEVREGTVSFTRRPVPADVPGRYVFRLDAQRDDLIAKDAENNVSRVDNFGGHKCYGEDICLTTPYAKPKFVPDALGAGRPVLDLGAVSDSGAFLRFATNTDSTVSVKIPGVCSVVAVVGAQNGGGTLVAAPNLARANQATQFTDKLLVPDYAGVGYSVYVDGLRRVDSGYPTPGYHVVALQAPNSASGSGAIGLGGSPSGMKCGGLRIAEAVVYDRILTEEELRDASAYLMNKWFGRVPGDYQNPAVEPGVVELQKLKMSDGTTIDVPEGGIAKVGRLDVAYPIDKTGKGTLVLQSAPGAEDLMTVKEGKVIYESAPDVPSSDALAKGASLHLDASDAASVETERVGETDYVTFWHSPDWANVAYSIEDHRPSVNASELLNNRPTIAFGAFGTRTSGNYLVFGKACRSIKSAYVVWRARDTRVSMLGTSLASEGAMNSSYDYVSANGNLFRNNLFSSVCTNGVPVERTLPMPTGQWLLVEAHSKADDSGGLAASALCADRDNNGTCISGYGGADYAEVILFERELSEREKVATRNYLLKKWFPSAPQTELPATPSAPSQSISSLNVSGDVEQMLPSGETMSVGRITGTGTLEKTGGGTLAVRDVSGLEGSIIVREGTMKLTGAAPQPDASPVTEGLVYHADASWGVVTEATTEGVQKVVEWKSRLDDGWSAVPPITWGDAKPRYLENALSGKSVIDMAVPTSTNRLQCLRFRHNGTDALLSGLQTVIWVFGSQNGGGYLLGGGDANNAGTAGREWARIAAKQIPLRYPTLSDPILYGDADRAARWGSWHVDGVAKTDSPESPDGRWLSGGWNIIAWDTKKSSRMATADGFGFDRSIVDGSTWSDSNGWRMTGQQRLAEVLFYNRTLTEAERETTEAYLKAKWGLLGVRMSVTNATAVVLADGAYLDMDGKSQYLASLGGTGSVVNGSDAELTLGAIAHDCASDARLSIASTVVIEEGFAVHFENFPADGSDVLWKIADVSGSVRRMNGSRIAVTGVPDGLKARIRLRDGGLYVEFSKGLMLIMR